MVTQMEFEHRVCMAPGRPQDDEAGIGLGMFAAGRQVDGARSGAPRGSSTRKPAQLFAYRSVLSQCSCSAIALPGIFGTPPIATLPISPSQ